MPIRGLGELIPNNHFNKRFNHVEFKEKEQVMKSAILLAAKLLGEVNPNLISAWNVAEKTSIPIAKHLYSSGHKLSALSTLLLFF